MNDLDLPNTKGALKPHTHSQDIQNWKESAEIGPESAGVCKGKHRNCLGMSSRLLRRHQLLFREAGLDWQLRQP
jgi:hypothetical protein